MIKPRGEAPYALGSVDRAERDARRRGAPPAAPEWLPGGAAMSKLSRDKGLRAERAIVAAHADLGVAAERVPLSGASRYQGNGDDVDEYGRDAAPLVCEVKPRASGEGFATG